MRAWVKGGKTRQIQWFYDRKGIDAMPACYLQEVGSGEKPGSGVLMLDTNLLDDEWIEKVKLSAYESLRKPSFSYSSFDDALDHQELKQYIRSFGRDATIYDEVRAKARLQQDLIERAAQLKNVVIIGHIPRHVKSIAEMMTGRVTIIAGHRHKSYDSEKIRKGANPRVLITGAPTFGAGGIEMQVKPKAYLVDITSADSEAKVNITSITQ